MAKRSKQTSVERIAKRLQSRTLRELEPYGVSETHLEQARDALARRSGKPPHTLDVLWALLKAVLRQKTTNHERADVYGMMAGFLRDAGQDGRAALREQIRCKLRADQETGRVKAIEVMAAPNCCDACQAQDGRRVPIDEAVEFPPVPCAGCTTRLEDDHKFPWCRCNYRVVLRDD